MFEQAMKSKNLLKGFWLLLFCLLLPSCAPMAQTGAIAVPEKQAMYFLEISPGNANSLAITGKSSKGAMCKGVLRNITRPKGENCEGQSGEIVLECADGVVIVAPWVSRTCSSGVAYGVTNEGHEIYAATGGDWEDQKASLVNTAKMVKEIKLEAEQKQAQGVKAGASHAPQGSAASATSATSAAGAARSTVVSGNEKAVPPKILPGNAGEPVVQKVRGSGTGFFVSNDGLVVTNAHVVKGARLVSIANSKNQELIPARVIKLDSANDLAVLKTNVQSSPIPLAGSFNAQKGEEVLSLGYPLPKFQGIEQKATFGRVNALSGIGGDTRLAQVDLPLQPGNSGGPLLNSKGELIGIVTSTLTGEKIGVPVQNVNYAVKVDYLQPLLASVGAQTTKSPQAQKKSFSDIVSLREDAVVIVVVQ